MSGNEANKIAFKPKRHHEETRSDIAATVPRKWNRIIAGGTISVDNCRGRPDAGTLRRDAGRGSRGGAQPLFIMDCHRHDVEKRGLRERKFTMTLLESLTAAGTERMGARPTCSRDAANGWRCPAVQQQIALRRDHCLLEGDGMRRRGLPPAPSLREEEAEMGDDEDD